MVKKGLRTIGVDDVDDVFYSIVVAKGSLCRTRRLFRAYPPTAPGRCG